jgi:nitroimidazol reductase NimA-like FMN-containing flavoprotein (pyridoxamine 5'-phosphate oxidase superfamily)
MQDVKNYMDNARLASFATVTGRSEPHVVPVFFTYDDGKVYVQTDRKSVKIRNLLSNENVSVAVYSGEEAVILRGKGRIIEDNAEFIRRTQDHIGKYKLKSDEEGKDSLGIPLFDRKRRCVVEVSGKHLIFW